jgi:hypothetical protein
MTESQQEECAVYSVILNELYVRDNANPVIIEKVTDMDPLAKLAQEDLNTLKRVYPADEVNVIIKKLLTVNEQSMPLPDCFNLKVQTILLSREEVDGITRGPNGWGDFLKKYPHQSLIWLSRIAFNREMNKALVYTGSESGGKSGQGSFVLFIKENGAWILKYTIVSWRS